MAFNKSHRLEHILNVAMPPINAFDLGYRGYLPSAMEAFEKTTLTYVSSPKRCSWPCVKEQQANQN